VGVRVHGAAHGGGDGLRHDGDDLRHALERRPAEDDVGGGRCLPPSTLHRVGVMADQFRADQRPQPDEGQLRGLWQHHGFDGPRDVRIEVRAAPADLLSDRAGPGPAPLAVRHRRPGVGQ
jgi:hypothetical protein